MPGRQAAIARCVAPARVTGQKITSSRIPNVAGRGPIPSAGARAGAPSSPSATGRMFCRISMTTPGATRVRRSVPRVKPARRAAGEPASNRSARSDPISRGARDARPCRRRLSSRRRPRCPRDLSSRRQTAPMPASRVPFRSRTTTPNALCAKGPLPGANPSRPKCSSTTARSGVVRRRAGAVLHRGRTVRRGAAHPTCSAACTTRSSAHSGRASCRWRTGRRRRCSTPARPRGR